MPLLMDGGSRYLPSDLENRPWLGVGDDLMKVIHVDEAMGQVVFIQRFAKDTTHLKHTHHCTAIAYTLAGCWTYEGEGFPEGSVGFEPPGTTHTATTRNGDTAEVFIVLTAGPGAGRLLELETPDGQTFELDVGAFTRLQQLTSNDQWPAFAESLLAAG